MQNKGLTLLEILITLSIAILIAGIGFANLAGFRVEKKLENEAEKLKIMLRSAQEKSRNQENGYRYGVSIENKTGSSKDIYSIFSVNESLFASSSYTGIPGTSTLSRAANASLDFSDPSSGNRKNIVFNKVTGQPTQASTSTLQARNSSSTQKSVVVHSNGRIEEQ